MKKKIISIIVIMTFVFSVNASHVLAHVVVKPAEVGVAERVNFAVSVPTEEDIDTVGVRLIIPDGLQSVRPNAKPGWTITITKSGEGESAQITEIVWTGGTIPPEQRDEFVFSAQVPANATELHWKAYQTYANGEVVAWDVDPKVVKAHTDKQPSGSDEESGPKPYSITTVVNDLAEADTTVTSDEAKNDHESWQNIGVVAALIMSGASLWLQYRNKKK